MIMLQKPAINIGFYQPKKGSRYRLRVVFVDVTERRLVWVRQWDDGITTPGGHCNWATFRRRAVIR